MAPSLATPARAVASAVLARAAEAALTFAVSALQQTSKIQRADGATVLDSLGFVEMRDHVAVSDLASALVAGNPLEQRTFVQVLRVIADGPARLDAGEARRALDAFCALNAQTCAR